MLSFFKTNYMLEYNILSVIMSMTMKRTPVKITIYRFVYPIRNAMHKILN